MSPNGTTRHELWLRFADVCTGHPNEAKVAGVDFDGIVRAVLKGQDVGGGGSDSGSGSGALGFKVFDNSSKDDEQQQTTNNKSTPQVLNHRLGEMEGTLWTRLAEYHVRAGDFELARSVYEEALDAITRVRDFSLVFDAYVKFEEGVIEALMELMEEEEDDEEDDDEELPQQLIMRTWISFLEIMLSIPTPIIMTRVMMLLGEEHLLTLNLPSPVLST